MKQLFALFLLLAALSTLAQQMPTVKTIDVKTRTETYQSFRYFTDSIVFTIVGKNDTTLVQTFYPNGKTDDIQWRKDSTHWYNSDGFLTRKQYFNFFKPNQDISQDFDEEEQMKRQTITEKNDKRVQQWHDKEMLSEYQLVKRTPSVNYEIWRDGQGTKWASREQIDKGDGKYLCKDSLFFSNGRLHKVGVWKGTQYEKHWLNYNEFNEKGQLVAPLIPISAQLIAFKDNYNCYYGLKNKQGDTLFKPQFDYINTLNHEDFYVTTIGSRVQLRRKDGTIVAAHPMEAIYDMTYQDASFSVNFMSLDRYDDKTVNNRKPPYFCFKLGDKYGIIDSAGQIVLPPQYDKFYETDRKGRYFAYCDKYEYGSKLSSKIVDRQGRLLFQDKYPYLSFYDIKGYFKTASQKQLKDTTQLAYFGLVDSLGNEILPMLYRNITIFDRTEGLLLVETGKVGRDEYGKKVLKSDKKGIFNYKTKKWLLTPDYDISSFGYMKNVREFNLPTSMRFGLINDEGKILLNPEFESIYSNRDYPNHLIVKKKEYQVYNIDKNKLSAAYDYLKFAAIDYSYSCYIIAKRKGKWGIIDADENIIVPFDYDYAGSKDYLFAFVKGDSVVLFSGVYFPKPMLAAYRQRHYDDISTFSFTQFDGDKAIFLVDKTTAKVILPPQYKIVQEHNSMAMIVENEQQEQKILFKNDRDLIPYPFAALPTRISSNKSLVLFINNRQSDSLQIGNLKTGKVLDALPIGGIALGSETFDNYFVSRYDAQKEYDKHTTQERSYRHVVKDDTLSYGDNEWLWYDSTGKRLRPDTFRYPLHFDDINDLGIGMVGNKFGIWRADGSVFAPPQYESIRRDYNSNLFLLFQNIGLKTWLTILDETGKTYVKTGYYDGISPFYSAYALVSNGDKIGLIDTSGKEIIAPLSIANNEFNFLDSLNYLYHHLSKKIKNNESITYPDFGGESELIFSTIHFNSETNNFKDIDSSDYFKTHRNLIYNLLMSSQLSVVMIDASKRQITRAYETIKTFKEYTFGRGCGTGICHIGNARYKSFDPNFIAFCTPIIGKSDYDLAYFNYRRLKNGQWEKITLADVLQLTLTNRPQINDMLGRKIQALKDKDIDCGNTASFLERSENTCFMTEKGISFYFQNKGSNYDLIPIDLTWQELKAFVK